MAGLNLSKPLALIMAIIGIAILVAMVVGIYPTLSTSLGDYNTSGIPFAGVVASLGPLVLGAVILIAIIVGLVSLVSTKGNR